MEKNKKIGSALISVFYKDGLEPIVAKLNSLGVKIYSTGGTKEFIEKLGIKVTAVEDLTSFPSVFGGRVKTLHPKVFGGILNRRENQQDQKEMKQHQIEPIDLVMVDLYPFEETLASGASDAEIIEKIDIGGISLIRAAAKNFEDVLIISSTADYGMFSNLLNEKQGSSSITDRRELARRAFKVSSEYDHSILNYFSQAEAKKTHPKTPFDSNASNKSISLRYGENPHQQGVYHGNLDEVFEKLNGKELSYNNLLDLDAALGIIAEFSEPTFAVIKHNNPCGLASRPNLTDAWKDALAADSLSAFGGVLVCNGEVDEETAEEVNKIFFEVLAAPSFHYEALKKLKEKKNRILLQTKVYTPNAKLYRSILNGVIEQDVDRQTASEKTIKVMTKKEPSKSELVDLLFTEKIVKHAKSNAIVLGRGKQILGIGSGLTSRVDALHHAIQKAKDAGMNLNGAVMASDAFFPFPDCVEIAHRAGITSIIQPGGSMKDAASIEFCDEHSMSMVFTSLRHFKH